MMTVFRYADAFALLYGLSIAEPHKNDIVDDMMLSPNQLMESRSSYRRSVTYFYLVTKVVDELPVRESQNEGQAIRKNLGTSYLDSNVLYARRPNFDVLLIKTAGFYVNHSTK